MDAVVAARSVRGNVVCDLDGVIYLHSEAIPGAGAALHQVAAMGHRVLFVTNSSTGSPMTVADRIKRLTGYPAQPDQVITSSQAAAGMLGEADSPSYVVGGEGILHALAEAGLAATENWHRARSVLVGMDWELTYPRLRDAAAAVRNGARFVATNVDATFPTATGLWPGSGAIVAAVRVASGRPPEVAGKPYQPMRDLVRGRLGVGPTWVVGDHPSTDLAMARAEGWTGVLVLTGITRSATSLPEDQSPDLVLPSIAELPAALDQ